MTSMVIPNSKRSIVPIFESSSLSLSKKRSNASEKNDGGNSVLSTDDQSDVVSNGNDSDFDQLLAYETERGVESCRYRGYTYRLTMQPGSGGKRWRCRYGHGCLGKLWTNNDNSNPIEKDEHCHPQNTYHRDRILRDMEKSLSTNPQSITDQSPAIDSSPLVPQQPPAPKSTENRRKRNYRQSAASSGNDGNLGSGVNPILVHLLASTMRMNSSGGPKQEMDDDDDGDGGNLEDFPEEAQSNHDDDPNSFDDSNYPIDSHYSANAQMNDQIDYQESHHDEPNQEALDNAEVVLSLMATDPNDNGQRLERFLGDIVERLSAFKEAMQSGDQSTLRKVIGEFMEIPLLLNRVADEHELGEERKKRRKMMNGGMSGNERNGR